MIDAAKSGNPEALIAPTARHASRENERIKSGHSERSRGICFEPDISKSRFLSALEMTVPASSFESKRARFHARNDLYFPKTELGKLLDTDPSLINARNTTITAIADTRVHRLDATRFFTLSTLHSKPIE